MKKLIVSSWRFTMDNRHNPLKYLDLASQHYFMQVLGWMWSMVFSLSYLSIVHFSKIWLAHLLLIAGVFITVAVFKRAESMSGYQKPLPALSKGSVCVWQLDKEA